GATENSEVTNDPELISNLQLIPPTIMVFPNPYQNSKYMDAAPGSPMSGIEMFESQFINELIPFIDAQLSHAGKPRRSGNYGLFWRWAGSIASSVQISGTL